MWSPDGYVDALVFAAEQHRGQAMPGSGLPYTVHLSLVAAEVQRALVAESFERPDLAVQCALLHDSIEDTDATYALVESRFGKAVADGVLALTKDERLPKKERMQDSLQRIRTQPAEVWIVKMADRITNLRTPPDFWTPDKKRGYRAEAGRILDALQDASPFLAQRLSEKIDAYGSFIE